MTRVPTIDLGDGAEIPQLGFGVFQVPPADTQSVVELALQTGYRHVDTAAAYRNEEGVGRAIAASGLSREEIFVTTKLWNDDQGEEPARRAFEASLDRLGVDHVDLYLIHWPVPARDLFVETWKVMEGFREEGKARAIGVSNFRRADLERLAEETETRPGRQPDRASPALPAGRAALGSRPARHRHRSLEPACPGPGPRRPGDRRDRRQARQDTGPGDPPLAPAARQRGDPEVGDPGADRLELRPLRLRARRRRHGGARRPRRRDADRARSGDFHGAVSLATRRTRIA